MCRSFSSVRRSESASHFGCIRGYIFLQSVLLWSALWVENVLHQEEGDQNIERNEPQEPTEPGRHRRKTGCGHWDSGNSLSGRTIDLDVQGPGALDGNFCCALDAIAHPGVSAKSCPDRVRIYT